MKNKKLLALLVAATMASTATFTACGNKNNENNGEKNKNVAAKDNGETDKNNSTKNNEKKDEPAGEKLDKDQYVCINLGSDPKTLDISRASDTNSSDVMTQIMDGLTRVVAVDGKDKVVPAIAESWEASEDGMTWTFHLRKDALWSDGVPVTAKHFEYGIKRTIEPATGSNYAWILYPIVNAEEANAGEASVDEIGVKAIDDYTLEFKLKNPTPYFEQLSYFKVMLPQRQDVVEKYGETYGSEAEHILSTGAFILEDWKHQDEITFVKNPKYYAADEIKLDRIKFDIIKERSATYNAMLSGMLDMGGVSDPQYRKKFEETGNWIYSSRPKPSSWFSYFNQDSKYFKNQKVRLAFSLAVDRDELNEVNWDGSLLPAYAFIPPTVIIGDDDFREKADSLPIKELQKKYPDPKALLIEGLKELGEDPDPGKMDIKILSPANSEKGRERLSYVIANFKSVLGVTCEPDIYDWGIFQQKTKNGEFELAAGSGWTGDYNDPMTFMEIWVSGSPIYPTGFSNAEYDELIEKSTQTMDAQVRYECFKRAEEILLEEAVFIPELWTKTSTYVAKYLKGYVAPLFGSTDFTRAYTVGRE